MSARSSNMSVNELVFQEKVNDLAKKKKKIDIGNFRAPNESAERWNARNNVKFKAVSCEEKSLTPEMTGP